MWLIVGLGNPGRRYVRTRHNVGFKVIEEIAERYAIVLTESKNGYRVGRGSIEESKIFLVEPLLYMNRSGLIVGQLCRKFTISLENLIVVHDDLDMETGRLRIRKTGSSGGHKGIESIIQSIGSRDFMRVKIGIGREVGVSAEDYVLSKFGRAEVRLMNGAVERAADAIQVLVTAGIKRAMNIYNA